MEEKPTTPTPEISEDMTLNMLFTTMNQVDNLLIDLTPEQMEALGAYCLKKIDNYKYIEEKYNNEIARIMLRVDEYNKIIKSLKSRLASLKEYLMFHVKQNGGKLNGTEYTVSVTTIKGAAVEIDKLFNPDQKVAINYPELVKKVYSWDKTALKAYLKSSPEENPFRDNIRLKDSDRMKWNVKTDLTNKKEKK